MNGLRTALLLGATGGAVLLVGSLFGRTGLVVAAVAAPAVVGCAWFRSGALTLRAMHARPVSEPEAPALHRIVRELSRTARAPVPRLYISGTAAPTSFATGRGPRHAALCVTTGLLDLLDERELRAVVGHELTHVHHRDTLVSSVAGALATVIGLLAGLAVVAGASGDDERPDPVAVAFLAVLGPLAAGLVRAAVGRSREYRADEGAAALTGDPLALASALRKLALGAERAPLPPTPRLTAQSHLMIAGPFHPGERAARPFATHPPPAERIRRLEAMALRRP